MKKLLVLPVLLFTLISTVGQNVSADYFPQCSDQWPQEEIDNQLPDCDDSQQGDNQNGSENDCPSVNDPYGIKGQDILDSCAPEPNHGWGGLN